jgi:hypothetical protein
MNNIEWRPIRGYEGHYEVSNDGQVKSVARDCKEARWGKQLLSEKILKPGFNMGYPRVALCKGGKIKNVSVHRLVADAFVHGKTEVKCQVNHINGIKHDNRYTNLEWVSPKENTIHAVRLGLKIGPTISDDGKRRISESKLGLKHHLSRPLIDLNTGVFYESILEYATLHKRAHSSIRWILEKGQSNLKYA